MAYAQIHLVIAAVFGASGVALWAWATHAGQPSATIAAQMLLIHAAAILGWTAASQAGLLGPRLGAILIPALALGVALFAGDLALRAAAGQRLFPMASPLGGLIMIGAWIGLGVSALVGRRA